MNESGNEIITGNLFADRYQLLKVIGSGSTSVVYEAIDTDLLNTKVAIKILQNSAIHPSMVLRQIGREAHLTRLISSPHVVHVYDFGTTADGTAYLVMEFVRGHSLDGLMKESTTPLDTKEIISIVAQILEGLAAAHAVKIGHRDLKPENILIDETGNVKVTDFGMGSLLESEYSISRTEETLGSPRYLAPEQLRGSKGNYQTDIYALGVIIFELLAGEPPFRGETFFELALEQLHQSPPWEKIAPSKCPQWLIQFTSRCLEKDVAKRFSSAAEALDIINEYRQDNGHQRSSSGLRRQIKKVQGYYRLHVRPNVIRRSMVYLIARPQRLHASLILLGVPVFYIALVVSQPIYDVTPQGVDLLWLLPFIPLYLRRGKRICRQIPDLIILAIRSFAITAVCWSIVLAHRFDRAAWSTAEFFLNVQNFYGISLKPITSIYGFHGAIDDPDQFYSLITTAKQNRRNKYFTAALIRAGFDLNLRLKDGNSGAMLYVKNEITDLRENFTEFHSDISMRTPEGKTLFELALTSDESIFAVDFARDNLLKPIDANGNIPLGCMILANRNGEGFAQLENSPPPEFIRAMVRYKNKLGQTLLHLEMSAVSKFSLATLSRLIDLGADPNSLDNLGDTPALGAIKSGAVDKLLILLQYTNKIDFTIRDRHGRSLLWHAINQGLPNIISSLISRDQQFIADPAYRTELLELAKSNGDSRITSILEQSV